MGVGGSAGGFGGGGGAAGATNTKCSAGCLDNEVCNEGSCVQDPCTPNSCAADQACKPNAAFTASECKPTCANVTCGAAENCEDGQCKPSGCGSGCPGGQLCASTADGGTVCTVDLCAGDAAAPCEPGEACDPATGACAPDPCNAVKCPAGQACVQGQCYLSVDAGTGDASID